MKIFNDLAEKNCNFKTTFYLKRISVKMFEFLIITTYGRRKIKRRKNSILLKTYPLQLFLSNLLQTFIVYSLLSFNYRKS